MDSKEYYSLLNIDRTASREEIKKAYRKLAMEFHQIGRASCRERV